MTPPDAESPDISGHELPQGLARSDTARRTFRQRAVRWLLLIFGVYVGVIVLIAALENSLVYFPSHYPDGDWTLPAQVDDAWFTSADGTKLHGWYLEMPQPRAVVLFCHGNGGHLAHRRNLMEAFRHLNVSALMWDYRGYGRCEGKCSETGILQDARAARAWLAGRAGIAEEDVVVWGESMGGGVAVDLAQDGARGLILENTFTSMPDVAACHYPFLPTRLLMRNRYNSLEKITRYHGPLLQVHGTADRVVPYKLGEQLFAAANEPKRFVAIEGADHNDPRTDQLWTSVDEFLEELAATRPATASATE